ncbi:50S ribosomal protein L9 [Litorilinea aerophila]|uniref:Large ribosomal subunit protein bL9 n=1 Tax=Litorilinea aerophila TaxID=1204385 RepID=A0A540VAT6_9CHLR|nr:50S ribosomal protein L9 [Litorilinea aerophila]MCC9078263.1 50S ribosomal protein L9 [Litorilinea aerophila]
MARMKVILTQDVPDLGLAGEVHSVAGGYARNYLMPRGLAILATKGALKQAEESRQAGIRRRARERANAEAQAEVIRQQRLLFEARAGENDRLYGSVTSADIAEKLAEATGFEVDRRKIQLDQPIRELGLYTLEIRLVPEVSAEFQVAVVREGETWADAEKRAAEKAAAEKAAAEKAAAEKAAAAQAQAKAAAAEAEEA